MALQLRSRRIEFPVSMSFAYDRGVGQMAWSFPREEADLRGIMLHTTQGRSVKIEEGSVESDLDLSQARRQARPVDKNGKGTGGYDFLVGTQGRVVQTNDPALRSTVHGHTGNRRFIGVSMCQTTKGVVTRVSLERACDVVDLLTAVFTLPRQVYVDADGKPFRGRLRQLEGNFGSELAGTIGHRNVWIKRQSDGSWYRAKGDGDPGDQVFLELLRRGYEAVRPEDGGRSLWAERQKRLGITADGIVGAGTRRAIREAGYPSWCWVPRPIDQLVIPSPA